MEAPVFETFAYIVASLLKHLWLGGDLVEGIALHTKSSSQSQHERERSRLKRKSPVLKDRAPMRRRLRKLFNEGTSNWVEHDSCAVAIGDFFHALFQVLFFRRNNVICAERQQGVSLIAPPCCCNCDGTFRL